jgi:hypothetical protein
LLNEGRKRVIPTATIVLKMEATVEKVRKINGTDFISSKAHVCIVGEK